MPSSDPLSRWLGFWAASLSLMAVFAASATPIPLYALYQSAHGLSYADLSLTAVFYFVGAITALLVFGRVSNYVGRKPVVLCALAIALLAFAVFAIGARIELLVFGRLLQGVSCGLASSAAAAFIADNAPRKPAWLASTVTGTGTMIGLTIGALTSGALVDVAPSPILMPYIAVGGGLVCVIALVSASRESVSRQPGALGSLRPSLALPVSSRRLFPVASCLFVATWALGGFYQAFGPSLAADHLGASSALIAAAVFSSYMIPSALGGPLVSALTPATVQRLGSLAFAVCVALVLAALMSGQVVAFLMASVGAGVA